jgi:hypothetical protein
MEMTCNQNKCSERAGYRFTWPGGDEAGICKEHIGKLRMIANAMGLYLQIIPIEEAKP